MVAETEVRYMITEAGRQALAEAELSDTERSAPILQETRLVFAYLQDNEESHDRAVTLKAEARADAPGVGSDPADYLAMSLQSYVEDTHRPDESILEGRLFQAAVNRVNWGQLAEWVMRNDQTFPPVDVGDLEESQE